MAKIKIILKAFIPPLAIFIFRKYVYKKVSSSKNNWTGSFSNWEIVSKVASGYDQTVILEKSKIALLKVKSGQAIAERDTVLFNEPIYCWPLLFLLLKLGIENNGYLSVLDFGGSLGSSYFQNKNLIEKNIKLEWNIIEQPHFVECGKQYFEDHNLKFYYTIDECFNNSEPKILLLNSVLPYLRNPYEWINNFQKFHFSFIIIDRTSFIYDDIDRLTLQTVSKEIYEASYPCWFFNENNLMSSFAEKYEIFSFFDNPANPSSFLTQDGKEAYWKSIILKRK